MIDSKQAARLRHRKSKGQKLKPVQLKALDAYEAARAAGTLQQPEPETVPGGAAPQPSEDSPEHTPEAGAAPADPTPDVLEAPPPVRVSDDAPKAGGRWQDKYKIQGGIGDGREMLCTMIAGSWRDAVKAMESDLELIGKKPVVTADQMYNVYVLAVDQLLPDRAKLTPPIAAALGTTITTVQRFANHKRIAEVQKADPSIEEYKRKIAREHEQRKAEREQAQEAELVQEQAKQPEAPPVQRAAPPPSDAPTLEQVKANARPIVVAASDAPVSKHAIVADDGRMYG